MAPKHNTSSGWGANFDLSYKGEHLWTRRYSETLKIDLQLISTSRDKVANIEITVYILTLDGRLMDTITVNNIGDSPAGVNQEAVITGTPSPIIPILSTLIILTVFRSRKTFKK